MAEDCVLVMKSRHDLREYHCVCAAKLLINTTTAIIGLNNRCRYQCGRYGWRAQPKPKPNTLEVGRALFNSPFRI